MQLVDRWLAEAGAEADQKTVLAISKAAQEVVEACLDLVAMMLRDSGRPPQDDYTNIDQALQTGILSPATKAGLQEANGLRNRLIHHYNTTRVDQLFASLQRLLPTLKDYLREVRKWMQRNFSD
jgi:uncharacterized protein YutE (UPF0331/DUF86 family)